MNYFVSIDNSPYDSWQIELLIESFKLHNLQDHLYIGVAGGPAIGKNLSKHSHIMHHASCKYNSIYSVFAALYSGFITEPFMLLHPDMILLEPYQTTRKENIIFEPFKNELKTDFPVMIGGTMIFNLVAHKFFQFALAIAEKIEKENTEEPNNIVKAAWTHTILQSFPFYDCVGTSLELSLMHTEQNHQPIIHYKTGLLPSFDKKIFNRTISITDKTPYETLLEQNPTNITNYVHKVIHSYQGDL